MWILEHSGYLYLLLVLPALAALFLFTFYWQRSRRAKFGNSRFIKILSPDRSVFKMVLKFVVILLALGCVVVALANPQYGTGSETTKLQGIDIVFAVDVSRSMLAEDVAPNRLDRAKQIVTQLINRLGSDRIGIVGYAGSAYPVLPITSDFAVARMYLQGMNTNTVSSQGTAIGDAVKLSGTYFNKSRKGKLLVLISDGEDHGKDAAKAAKEALKNGIKIITVGIGTTEGGPIPLKEDGITQSLKRDEKGEVVITRLYPDQLKAIAETTKGEYIYGGNTKVVANKIMNAMAIIDKTASEAKSRTAYAFRYQWFAAIAFALLFLDIFLLERKTAWLRRLNLFNEKEQ